MTTKPPCPLCQTPRGYQTAFRLRHFGLARITTLVLGAALGMLLRGWL